MSYLSKIVHAYESGEADWHCTRDALEAIGYFDDHVVLMIGECPESERRQYGELMGLSGMRGIDR